MSILSSLSIFERNVTETLDDTRVATDEADYHATPEETTLVENDKIEGLGLHLIAYDILIPVIGVLVIVTNLLVVVSSGLLLRKGQEPRCTYLLLGNVAMADLVAGLTVVISSSYSEVAGDWSRGRCCLHLGIIVSSVVASVYSVALIAVDRFLYILHGLKYHRLVYIKRVRSMIAATWLFGLLIGFLPLVGWSGDSMNGKRCWFSTVAPPKLIIITNIVGTVPVLFIIVIYSIILYRAIGTVVKLKGTESGTGRDETNGPTRLRMFRGGTARITKIETISEKLDNGEVSSVTSIQQQSSGCNSGRSSRSTSTVSLGNYINSRNATGGGVFNRPMSPTKWKAIKVVLFTTGSLVCTWLPYFTACTVYVFCDAPSACRKLKFSIIVPLGFLCFMNSLLNPIIYAWWHNGFRSAIKKMYRRRKKMTTLKNNLERSHALVLKMHTSQVDAL